MKKYISILFIFGLSYSSFSQDFGLKAGLNIGKERISAAGVTVTSDASISFLAGVYSSFSVSDQISLAPEIIYSVDGGEFNVQGFTGKDRLSYISVPLLIKYRPIEKFNLHAGPQLGFLINAETEINGQTIDISEGIKSTNFSFAFGGETNFDNLNVGIRYILGLSNISEDTDLTGEVTLNTIQIYLSTSF